MILEHVKGVGLDCPDFYDEKYCETCIYSDECGMLLLELEESRKVRPKPRKGQRALVVE